MTSIKSTRICSVAGCESKHYCKGHCQKHYWRMHKTGTTELKSSTARFWEKVDRLGPDECWEWTAGFGSCGYGHFRLRGKTRRAHRLSWEIHNGPIPKGEGWHGTCVCHKCDNKLCVNPDHLFLGTNADNMADRDAKGRQVTPKGEAHGRSKLTAVDVQVMRNWYRSTKYTQQSLADVFGITPSNVKHIVNYRTWRHIA